MTKPKKTSNKASKAKVPTKAKATKAKATKAKAAKAKEKTPTKATATPIKSSSSSSSQQTQKIQYTQQQPTKEEKASRNLWLNSIVNDLVEKRQESKNRLPHDTYTKIVKDFKAMCPWLTKDMLRSRVRRRIEKIEKERKNQALGISTGASSKLPVAGIPPVHNPHTNQTLPQTQPKTNETTPSTAAFAAASTATATTTNPQDDHYLKQCMIPAKNEIVLLYAQESKKSREWGLYKKIHDQVKETRNLPESFNFPYTTAKKRIRRQKLIVH